jgi:hypothetical protein
MSEPQPLSERELNQICQALEDGEYWAVKMSQCKEAVSELRALRKAVCQMIAEHEQWEADIAAVIGRPINHGWPAKEAVEALLPPEEPDPSACRYQRERDALKANLLQVEEWLKQRDEALATVQVEDETLKAERDRYCGQLEKIGHYFSSLIPDWRDDSTDMADAITNYSQALKAERDKFQMWYYIAEETLCSCHLPDKVICEWHGQNPGAPDAEVFTLADRAEKAEAAHDEAVRKIREELDQWHDVLTDETATPRMLAYREGLQFALAALGAWRRRRKRGVAPVGRSRKS